MAADREVPGCSVVVPVYNEADNIERLLHEIYRAAGALGRTFEVILVDDGSTDRSLEIMVSNLASHPGLRVLTFERNAGQSAALAAGFDAARGDVFLTMDADLQNDPADFSRLLEALEGCDVVVGWRRVRHDSLVKRITSRVGNRIRNWLTHEDIADTGCSLKAFRREAARAIVLFDGMHRFMPTLCRMRGFRVAQVEVGHRPRLYGRTKYGVFDRLRVTVPDLMAVRWMQKRALNYRAREVEHP